MNGKNAHAIHGALNYALSEFIHSYCNCVDFVIKGYICKHIYACVDSGFNKERLQRAILQKMKANRKLKAITGTLIKLNLELHE